MKIGEKYSEKEVRTLFRVTRQRLYYWRKIGLLPGKIKGSARGYSFTDLVSIKIILNLVASGVRVHKIQESMEAIKKLYPGTENPLIKKALFVMGKEIFFFQGRKALEAKTGQYLLFQVGDYIRELNQELKLHKNKLRQRKHQENLVIVSTEAKSKTL